MDSEILLMNTTKTYTISDEFYSVYMNFNVICQIEKMKKLSKKELYLLLTLALDKFDEDDPIVFSNMKSFREEILDINDIQSDKKPTNQDLIELTEETDIYIDTDCIRDKNGKKLPEPLDKDEVRDKKINLLDI